MAQKEVNSSQVSQSLLVANQFYLLLSQLVAITNTSTTYIIGAIQAQGMFCRCSPTATATDATAKLKSLC